MPTKVYRCKPCEFEYQHFYFDTVPSSAQKPVPPCPLCAGELTYEEPISLDNYDYRCWESEGGCGITFSVEHLIGKAPETYPCPICKITAKLKTTLNIVHGKGMNKGSSLDVVIGRNADERWKQVIERKAVRDKIRNETGTQALNATGRNEYQPIKGGHLEAITVPSRTVNNDE
jgi:predicted nucleic acid-binding Zn ribbon protein